VGGVFPDICSGSLGGFVSSSRASADGGSAHSVDAALKRSDGVEKVCDTVRLSRIVRRKIPPALWRIRIRCLLCAMESDTGSRDDAFNLGASWHDLTPQANRIQSCLGHSETGEREFTREDLEDVSKRWTSKVVVTYLVDNRSK